MTFHRVIDGFCGWDIFPRPLERHSLVLWEPDPLRRGPAAPHRVVRQPSLREEDPHLTPPPCPHHTPAHSTTAKNREVLTPPNFPLHLPVALPTSTNWLEVLVTLYCHFCGVISPVVNQNTHVRVGVQNDLMTYKNDRVFLKPVGRCFIMRHFKQTIKEGEQNNRLLVTIILIVLIFPMFT